MIQPRRVAQEIKQTAQQAEGFVNIAADAVNVHASYRNIVENLLGNTIIIDNLNTRMIWLVKFIIGRVL